MYYSESLKIPNYLCDSCDTLHVWAVARLFQEVAGDHVASVGLGFSQLIAQGRAWVLCRITYDVRRLPHEGEQVELRTWSRGTDGLFAFREFQLIGSDGQAAVAATSCWAIIDFQTRRVTRMHGVLSPIETVADFATPHTGLGHVRLPQPPAAVGQFPVRPSMLDHTGHVNNSEYVKWLFDNLPSEQPPAFTLAVEYLQETRPDDTVTVETLPAAGGAFFQISNGRSAAVRARLSPLEAQ